MTPPLAQHFVCIPLEDKANFYTFTARTLADALPAMLRAAPPRVRPHAAGAQAVCDTRAKFQQTVVTKNVPGDTGKMTASLWKASAFIERCEFHYGMVYDFPQWTNMLSLPGAVRTEWKRYTDCLWTHEKGHAEVVKQVVRSYFSDKLLKLRICAQGASAQFAEAEARKQLLEQAISLFDLMEMEIEEGRKKYDGRTRHGETQGAVLETKAAAAVRAATR